MTIFLTPSTLRPYVYWCCSHYGQQYDDITNILRIIFGPESLITNRTNFLEALNEETIDKFKLPGKKILSFKRNVPMTQCESSQLSLFGKTKPVRTSKQKMALTIEKTFVITKIKGESEIFKECNRRFQALFQFYIDGASFIDSDPNWQYFICYLDHKIVGYTSVLEDKR